MLTWTKWSGWCRVPPMQIADLLPHGAGNAIPLKHLKSLVHRDGRVVRLAIRKERLAGVPICEDSKTGYFLAKNAGERDLCARRLRNRAAEIVAVADALEAADIEGGSGLD